MTRIDPQADLRRRPPSVFPNRIKLVKGIEYDEIGIFQYLANLVFLVGRTEGVDLLLEFLAPEPCLVETACAYPVQIRRHDRKGGKGGICLEGMKDLAPRAVLYVPQDTHVLFDQGLVDKIDRGLDTALQPW